MKRGCAGSMVAMMLVLAACKPGGEAGPSEPTRIDAKAPEAAAPATPVAAPQPAKPDRTLFVDRVWRVTGSRTVEAGTTYAFLGDGTLVVDSPNGTPLYGQWRFENDALTLVEEGQSYPTQILGYDGTLLRLRSHNPGEPVDIALTPAPDVPLPPAKQR